MHTPAGEVKLVSAHGLAAQLGAPEAPVILDVREPAEFVGPLGHVPGSVLIPLGSLRARLHEIPAERRRAIVVTCRSGARSFTAAVFLRQAGFEDVASLDGGMLAWNAAGLGIGRDG